MGNSIFKRLFGGREVRVLFLGLDAAGKTTLLYKLKLNEVVTTIPTTGFNLETITFNNVQLTAWDIGCRGKPRPILRHYYKGTDGIIFVVDSSDRERFGEALDDILRMISLEAELTSVPVLVLANKQDLVNAMTLEEIETTINTKAYLRDRQWKVFGVCAVTGEGLHDSLNWFTDILTEDMKQSWFADNTGHSRASNVGDSSVGEKNGVDTDKPVVKGSYFSNIFEYVKMKLRVW